MIWPFKPKKKSPVYDDFGQNNQVIFMKRMKAIKRIADTNMDAAKLHSKSHTHKSHVVISYEDLLTIWGISDKVIQDTIVPDNVY